MSSSLNALHSSVPSFGERIKENNGTVSILWARLVENYARAKGTNPDLTLSSSGESQLALDLIRIEKTANRMGLLECIKTFGLEVAVGGHVNLRYQVKRIDPEILTSEPLCLSKLIENAASTLHNRQSLLYTKMIQWACLQPETEVHEFYEKVLQIRGALTISVKSGGDPTIPFLKCVIEERAKWTQQCNDSPDQLSKARYIERDQIFKQIPDMYYNTFLGAQHPKVQENLKNQNDRVPITAEDLLLHIRHLQLKSLSLNNV